MSKIRLEFTELPESAAIPEIDDTVCNCAFAGTPCKLLVEEGQAVIVHNECDKPIDFYPEDLWTEFPVTVTVETCDNPGGWHGMTRCECGPAIIIEYDAGVQDE